MNRLAFNVRIGEAFTVNGPATVHVTDLRRNAVAVTVEAPASTRIERQGRPLRKIKDTTDKPDAQDKGMHQSVTVEEAG